MIQDWDADGLIGGKRIKHDRKWLRYRYGKLWTRNPHWVFESWRSLIRQHSYDELVIATEEVTFRLRWTLSSSTGTNTRWCIWEENKNNSKWSLIAFRENKSENILEKLSMWRCYRNNKTWCDRCCGVSPSVRILFDSLLFYWWFHLGRKSTSIWLYFNQRVPIHQIIICIADCIGGLCHTARLCFEIGRPTGHRFLVRMWGTMQVWMQIQYVVNVVEKNVKCGNLWIQYLAMVGHNDCRYLQHFATLGTMIQIWSGKKTVGTVTHVQVRQVTGMSSLEQRYQV